MAICGRLWRGALILSAAIGMWGLLRVADPGIPGRDLLGHATAAPLAEGEDVPDKAAALTYDRVRAAIGKGADWLLVELAAEFRRYREGVARRGAGDNSALATNDQAAGSICLETYALLMAGRVTGDPRLHFTSKEMADPVEFIVSLRSRHTYTLGLQASALSLLPNRPEFHKALTGVRDELLRGEINGTYTYYSNRPAGPPVYDHSNSQYGQLGVWACQDAGLEVPMHFWESVDAHWRHTQQSDGGWTYAPPEGSGALSRVPSTSTMTAAGVASLFLAQDELDRMVRLNPRPDKTLDAGIKWLTEHFDQYRPTLSSDLYMAYGLERVALSGGLKTLGMHDWYREGAALLLDDQAADGSWSYSMGGRSCGTGYALLFLSRGIAPVACGKLQYDGPWNARGRDCARFVHWLSKRTEKNLNWQTLSIDSDPDDWNVPVLVITGHGDPKFTADHLARLRRYVDNGGLIFSCADESDAAFTKAIRQKYAPAIFGGVYEMRQLPPSHPVFDLAFQTPKGKEPHLLGLSNGVREVWIHSPDDITASWQAYTTAKTEDFDVPANIYFYALGWAPHGIGLAPLAPPPPPPATRTLNIARLVYAGNWDPEPAAWGRYAAFARRHYGAEIQLAPVKIVDLDAAKTPIAHITGTTAFTPTEDQKNKLREFFAQGGVLLADAVGGNEVFAGRFQAAIGELFPAGALKEIPPESPLLRGTLPAGEAINSLEMRRFTEMPANRARTISLMEVQQNGRPVLVFSHADLTAGIGGIRTWGILGYTPETTRALVWNALMYLSPPNPAATRTSDASPTPVAPAPSLRPATSGPR